PAFHGITDRTSKWPTQSGHFAAGMNAVDFSEGHEKQMVISEPHYLGQSGVFLASGIDPADFSQGGEGAFGFDDQSGKLNDSAAVFHDTHLFGPLNQTLQAIGRINDFFGEV